AVIIFGVTVRFRQARGCGFGLGFGVGGVSGAGTTVSASSTLSAGLVSRPPDPVTVAVFTCRPTCVARPSTAIVTVWPGAIVPRLQVTRAGVTEAVPCHGVRHRYE